MRSVINAVVASILLLAGVTALAMVIAGVSLALGWAEGHPLAEDIGAWVGGSAVLVVLTVLVGRIWLRIYHSLADDD